MGFLIPLSRDDAGHSMQSVVIVVIVMVTVIVIVPAIVIAIVIVIALDARVHQSPGTFGRTW